MGRESLPRLTAAQFDEYRLAQPSHVEIRAMRAHGEKLTSEIPRSLMRCVCGVKCDSRNPEESYQHRRHTCAAQALDGI